MDKLKELINKLENERSEMNSVVEKLHLKIKEKEEQEEKKKDGTISTLVKAGLGFAASVAFSILSGKFSGAEVRITKT